MSKVTSFLPIFHSVFLSLFLSVESDRALAVENEWSSSFDIKAVNFPLAVSPAVNDQLYQGDVKLGLVIQGENLKFTGKLNYVADPNNKSTAEQSYFDLPEYNLKLKAQPFLFKIGTDIYNWGVTDGFNPLDLINTKTYFDPIHARKMGAGSLSMNYSGDWFELDLVYIPQARPSLLPGGNSRWLPRQIYISQSAAGPGVELLLPNQFSYSYLPRQSLGSPLQNNSALRLQAHLDNLELALYGYDGVASVPVITPVVSGTLVSLTPRQVIQVNSNVQLLLNDYRQQTAGFSFIKTLSSWQIKGEASWTQPGKESAQAWADAGILGVEKSWSVGSSGSLVTILQYSSANHAALPGNDLASLSDFFNSNWMLGGHFSWRDNDSITFFYSYDSLTTSWMGDLSYSRRFSDNWSLGLGGTTLDGPSSSPLGVYSNNKNVYLNLSWNY